MFEAARLTDPIAHTSALKGFLIGAVIGVALIAAVAFATFTCGFGVGLLAGLAAGFGASAILGLGEAIGKMFSSPSGTLTSGSSDVIVNGLSAVFATASTVACDKHSPVPLVAEGSTSVFINGLPAARKNDATTCGAKIDGGSSNVFIGGGSQAYLPVADEVPEWLRTSVDWAFTLAGLVGGLAGLVRKFGGITRAALPCAARFIGGFAIGEAVSRYVMAPVVKRVMGGLFGHPVDVTTGRKVLLADDEIDFVLASPMPLVCARFYASNLGFEGSLGRGWLLPWDLSLQQRDGKIWLTDAQGRETGFPMVGPGENAFSEAEQCYLTCTGDGRYVLVDLNEMYRDFGRLDVTGNEVAWVRRVEDRTGQWHDFARDGTGRVVSITTSGGQALRLHYAAAPSRLVRIECAHGGTPGSLVEYGYDAYGQLATVTDANGNVVRKFSYTHGLMDSHTNALGFSCSYEWAEIDGAPRVVACCTSEGERTTFRYDPATRQTWAEDDLGRCAHWQYDEHFQVVACTDLDGSQYRVEYDSAGMPGKFLLPGEREVTLAYDSAKRIVREVDPLGRVTETAYDGHSLRVSQLTLPDGSRWRTSYDYLGRILETIDPLGRQNTYEYASDLNPRPLAHVDARGGRQRLEWDRRGQLVSYTDCSGKTTRYQYDNDSYLVSVIDALGQSTRYKRRRTGEVTRITLPDGSTEEFRYDAAGLLVEQRGGAVQARRWARNSRGQVLDAVDPAARHLRYRYDTHGRLVELASDDNTCFRFAYDSGDRLVHETRPDGIERYLRYDTAGELVSLENIGVDTDEAAALDRPRRVKRFQRDKGGRLLAQWTETAITRFQWDDGDRLAVALRMPTEHGLELGVVPSEVRFDYDQAGRLVAEHGAEGTVHYTLDDLDNLVRLGLPHDQHFDLLTYGSGYVHQIRTGEPVISDFERDALHREVMRSQGRLTQRTGYDRLDRRAWQSAGDTKDTLGPGQGRLWRSYRYTVAGELAEESDALRGPIHFRYDAAGYLQGQTHGVDQRWEQFAWDAAGNLLDDMSRKSKGCVEGNRLRVWQDLRFDYDPWGNLSVKRKGTRQTQRFVFDADDRLIAVNTQNQSGSVVTRFEYDPLGRRTKVTHERIQADGHAWSEQKRFVWQGLRMVQEIRQHGVSSYVYSPDEDYTPLARLDAPIAEICADTRGKARQMAHVYHFHTDLVGTPLEVTDETGELAWAGKYSAWGKVEMGEDVALIPKIDQPLRYPGQYADDETGLHYNTFRFYDPDIGRFISSDPLGLAGGNNLYAYAPNSTSWSDPLGLMPWAEPSKVGHHLVPQSLARSTGDPVIAELFGSNTKTPTFFFAKPYVEGSHEAVHAAQRPHVGRLSGKWNGTPAGLVRAAGKGLNNASHVRGDLRIPNTGEVLATNVTPRQAYARLLRWANEQKIARGLGGCK
jgi:RHS repeat-associated protein